jgi:hypothetical protein
VAGVIDLVEFATSVTPKPGIHVSAEEQHAVSLQCPQFDEVLIARPSVGETGGDGDEHLDVWARGPLGSPKARRQDQGTHPEVSGGLARAVTSAMRARILPPTACVMRLGWSARSSRR